MDGYGVMKLNNGQIYTGKFRNHKYHGKGEMRYN